MVWFEGELGENIDEYRGERIFRKVNIDSSVEFLVFLWGIIYGDMI